MSQSAGGRRETLVLIGGPPQLLLPLVDASGGLQTRQQSAARHYELHWTKSNNYRAHETNQKHVNILAREPQSSTKRPAGEGLHSMAALVLDLGGLDGGHVRAISAPDNRTLQFNLGATTNSQSARRAAASRHARFANDVINIRRPAGLTGRPVLAGRAEANQSSSQVPRNNNQVQDVNEIKAAAPAELEAEPEEERRQHLRARQSVGERMNARRDVPLAVSTEPSLPSQQAAAAALAHALAQADRKAADALNAELCRNFSVGIQHETGGIFTSPSYPNPYPANLICTKLIEAPPGYFVVLEFRDQFNIEEAGNDCDNDKIEIRDGRFGYSKVLARYCGNRFPPEVRSSDEAMWLRFISDGSITHQGFVAVYRFEKQKSTKPPPPFECRFNVTSMEQFVSTVNGTENKTGIHSGIIRNTDVPEKLIDYSKQYNVSLECIWNITVTPGWKIYLIFANYEINRPNDCDSNFIEIYEENLTEESQTVKFCGTRTEPQQSRSNVFNIRHHAVPAASGSKFEIVYTAFRDKGPAGCDTREFDCDDGTCIHESLKCDGTVNCKYRYDEANEPGPCINGEDVQPFFETEHMVIILVVFLALVSGMCASIVISCWGKIQERRRRKQEYHMRKSREASMEGQINKLGQLYGSSSEGGAQNGTNTSTKIRMAAPVGPVENTIQRQFTQVNGAPAYALNGQRLVQLDPEQQLLYQQQQQQALNYTGNKQAIYSQQICASNPSLSNGGRLLAGELKDAQQERSISVHGTRSRVSDQQANKLMASQQASMFASQQQQQNIVPVSRSLMGGNRPLAGANGMSDSSQQIPFDQSLDGNSDHAMLSSLYRNQLAQKQQHRQQQYVASCMYTQQTDSQDSSEQAAGFFGSRQLGAVSTMPKLLKQNTVDQQQQQLILDPQQHQRRRQLLKNTFAYGDQRALTMSAMHQPTDVNSMTIDNSALARRQQHQQLMRPALLYGGQALGMEHRNNLSSSITCCNSLGADCGQTNETPLISDLMRRANAGKMQQPLLADQMSGTAATMRPLMQQEREQHHFQGAQATTIPRSISAFQLSKGQLRKSQQQQQLMQAQQQEQLQRRPVFQQQHQHQLSYKSMSDAGHANKHQPPNHSLSYPHACTGDHEGVSDSPALPPPPPPPNLLQARSNSSAGGQPQPQHPSDNKRAAFKVSRLDASQMTGDTLADSELLLAASALPPLGSMQSDEMSTESDATFGMLVDSMGNASFANNQQAAHFQQQAGINQRFATKPINQAPTGGQQLMIGQGYKGAAGQLPVHGTPQSLIVAHQQQQQRLQPGMQFNHFQQANYIAHLGDCNLVRCHQQRTAAAEAGRQQIVSSTRAMICDCDALERANQMRQRLAINQQLQLQQQQQQQQASSQHQVALANQQQQQQQRPSLLQSSDTREFDLDSEGAKALPYGYASDIQLQQQQQLSRFNRFRQQSSELTADDDEEDDEEVEDDEEDDDEELEVEQVCQRLGAASKSLDQQTALMDAYELDDSADQLMPFNNTNTNSSVATTVVRRHNQEEPLRDAGAVGKGHLGGSQASLSQRSCTCGSQSKLNLEREESDDASERLIEGFVGANGQPVKQQAQQADKLNDQSAAQSKANCDTSAAERH